MVKKGLMQAGELDARSLDPPWEAEPSKVRDESRGVRGQEILHRIYLVPGFFGFANIGDLTYFVHAGEILEEQLERLGIRAKIFPVPTLPTSSLRHRASSLLARIAETASEDDGPIHLVGHSAGGLDARMLVSPGVSLQTTLDPERYLRRVASLVTIGSPNFGTPLASFFSGVAGQKLLRLLSITTVYSLRYGGLPLSFLLRLGKLVSHLDDPLGWSNTVLDQMYRQLLSDFTPERRLELSDYFSQVSGDQSLIAQLTPEGMDLFNATTINRPGVRYGSVVIRSIPPSLTSRFRAGLNPYSQVTYSLYRWLHLAASRMPPPKVIDVTRDHAEELRACFGEMPTARDSDGIVPTLSQPWGEIIGTACADHLDIVGHFKDHDHVPPHIDWLSSGSHFRRAQFEAAWTSIARWIADTAVSWGAGRDDERRMAASDG